MLKLIKTSLVITILLIGLGIFLLSKENPKISEIDQSGPAVTEEILKINQTNNLSSEEYPFLKEDGLEFIELITQAEQLYANGYVDQSLNIYLEAYNANPDSTLPFLGIAKIYLDHEKIELAEENLLIAKSKGTLSTQAKILISRLNILKQNYEQAQEVLDSINNPNSETLYLNIILSLLSNKYENAQNYLAELLQKDSNNIYTQAATKLDEAFKIYDTFTDSPQSYLLTLSAENLIEVNEFALARPLLLQAISDKNDYRDAWVLLGYSYLQSNLLQDAEQALKKAKQVDPYFGTTYFYLGISKEALGQIDQAIDYLQQAEGFGYPYKSNIYLHLANSYYSQENYPKAADNYLKAIQSNALDIQDYSKPIWLFLEPLNNPAKALEISEQAFAKFPEQAISYNLLGWAQLANNQEQLAKKNLETALTMDPYLEAAHYNLGNLYKTQENFDIAKAYYQKAIKYAEENKNQAILDRAKAALNEILNTEASINN